MTVQVSALLSRNGLSHSCSTRATQALPRSQRGHTRRRSASPRRAAQWSTRSCNSFQWPDKSNHHCAASKSSLFNPSCTIRVFSGGYSCARANTSSSGPLRLISVRRVSHLTIDGTHCEMAAAFKVSSCMFGCG